MNDFHLTEDGAFCMEEALQHEPSKQPYNGHFIIITSARRIHCYKNGTSLSHCEYDFHLSGDGAFCMEGDPEQEPGE